MSVETPEALRAAARASRRAFAASPEGGFARTMRAAMTQFAQMRAAGVSFEDGVRGIEAVLRDAWPLKPSRFRQCAGCDDTGYHERVCTHDLRCNRLRCAHAEPAWEHRYVTPCDCPIGEKFNKGRSVVSDEERLAAVGRRKKSPGKGWSRPGM